MKARHESKVPEKAAPQSFTNLVFTCEAIGKPVEYEVPSDATTLRELWTRDLRLTCPHCGDVHRFPFRAAFIEGALSISSLDALVRT